MGHHLETWDQVIFEKDGKQAIHRGSSMRQRQFPQLSYPSASQSHNVEAMVSCVLPASEQCQCYAAPNENSEHHWPASPRRVFVTCSCILGPWTRAAIRKAFAIIIGTAISCKILLEQRGEMSPLGVTMSQVKV